MAEDCKFGTSASVPIKYQMSGICHGRIYDSVRLCDSSIMNFVLSS
jgi:hypothetical protein